MSSEFLNEDPDEVLLEDLLEQFDLANIMPYLKNAQITYRSLQYMKNEDFKEAVPPMGLRIEFREKLFAWRKEKLGIDDEVMAVPSNAQDWINRLFNCSSLASFTQSPFPSPRSSDLSLDRDLKNVLLQSTKGKSILCLYEKNKKLTDVDRNDLINVIVEEIMLRNLSLGPKEISNIVDEICRVFPSEINLKEYYYIPRNNGKKNPSGKLYGKYANCRAKRKRFGSPLHPDE